MHQQSLQELSTTLTQAYQFWNAGNASQAELLCRSVLAVWPGQAGALHLLGLMAHAYGNVDQAIDYLRDACRAPRAPAMFFRNLAEMCRRRGLLAEGERAGRQAVQLDPNHPDGWNNLGILLQEAGQVVESIDCLNRALTLRPNDPQIFNNLGNSSRLAGHTDAAERYYGRALALAPDFAQPHNNLAALTVMRGDFDAGAAHARAALECEPQFAEAYLNLADIENAQGHLDESLRWLDRLQAFAPEHIGALNARARLLLQAGLTEAAEDSARRAITLAPQNGLAQLRLGEVLHMQGRTQDALAAYRCAAALPGLQVEEACLGQSTLLLAAGREDEAHAVLAEARRQFPDSVRLLLAQADRTSSRIEGADLAKLEALAAAPLQLDASLRLGLHFVLGKALLDQGDPRRALIQLEQGNRLKRASFTYEADQISHWMEHIAASFPDILPAAQAAPDSTQAVFVVGMPCSGTTLVEQLLGTHPLLASAGERPALRQAVECAGDYPSGVADWCDETWHSIGYAYLEASHALGDGKRCLLDSMPGNFIYAGVIARALPGARIIHCRRDPLDTCMACYSQLFAHEQPFCYDLRELGLFFRAYRRLMTHWRSVLPAGCLIEVDYHAMCNHPEEERQRLFDFLGLSADDTGQHLPRVSLALGEPSGRWRDSKAQLAPLLDALGDEA